MNHYSNQIKNEKTIILIPPINEPYISTYCCYMLRYFKQHPICMNIDNDTFLELENLANEYLKFTNECTELEMELYSSNINKYESKIIEEELNIANNHIIATEKNFYEIIKKNIDKNMLNENISVFFNKEKAPIILIDLFKTIDLDGILDALNTQINDDTTRTNNSNPKNLNFTCFTDSELIPPINFNYNNFYYYLLNQLFSACQKENNIFWSNFILRQSNDILNLITIEQQRKIMNSVEAYNDYYVKIINPTNDEYCKINITQQVNNMHKKFEKKIALIQEKYKNALEKLDSTYLDKTRISINNTSKELFNFRLQNLYNRFLGLKLYDLLKDENVKTVPKKIISQYKEFEQYTSENDLNKLTIYYKTTKKCIEHGLLLPFSPKYRL